MKERRCEKNVGTGLRERKKTMNHEGDKKASHLLETGNYEKDTQNNPIFILFN